MRCCSVATCTNAVVVVAIEDSDELNGELSAAPPAASTPTTAGAADADAAAASCREGVEARLPEGGNPADTSLSEEELRAEVGCPS